MSVSLLPSRSDNSSTDNLNSEPQGITHMIKKQSAPSRKRRTLQSLFIAVVIAAGPAVISPAHAQFVQTEQEGTDLAGFWNSTEFKARFLAGYGVASDIEPKFVDPEEQVFYAEIRGLIFENPAQAIERLRRTITPQSSATLDFTLGALYFQEGQSANAVASYQKAIEKFPDFRRAHRNLGIVRVQEGDYENAVVHLTKTLKLGDSDGLIYGLLGVAYAGMDRHFPAESAFRNAIILEPDTIDWQLGLARSYLAQEKFQEGSKLLANILESNPDSDKVLSLQANVFVQLQQFEEAQVNLELLKEMGKAQASQLFLLGDLYLNDNFVELAGSAYSEAVARAENPQPERMLRAVRGFMDRGAFDRAEGLISRVRSTAGADLEDSSRIELLKLEARMAMARDEMNRVRDLMEQILRMDPLDGEALLMAGDYYNSEGDMERAMFRYESAARISGYEADGLVKQAQLYVQNSDYRKALTLLRKAQNINPRDNIKRYLDNVERLARASSS